MKLILQFFLKATQLEQMKMDYNMANEQREITKDIINRKEQVRVPYTNVGQYFHDIFTSSK